jgi:hypothetical protein
MLRAGEEPGPFGTLSIGLLPDAGRTPAGRLPGAVKPGFHGVKTHWIRGFMAFRLRRRTMIMMLMVPVWPESGFLGRAYPARRTPRKRAAKALRPVSAPMTARARGVRERMCRAAVTPEISTTTSLTISVVR